MRNFYIICFIFCAFSICSCAIIPKEVSRTIFFDIPARSNDLIIKKTQEVTALTSTESAIVEDEELSGLEFGSKGFFLPGFKISNSKLNAIEALVGGKIVIGYQDGSVFEVSLANKDQNEKTVNYAKLADGSSPILAMASSPNGKLIAISQFSVVTIVDVGKRKIIAQLHRVKGRILSMAWSPDSKNLLMGRANGDVFSWSLEEDISYTLDSLDVLELYETQSSPVVGISFHPSGRAFFVALENGSLFLVRLVKTEVDLGLREEDNNRSEIEKGSYVQQFGTVNGGVSSFFILPERDELLVVSFEGTAYRWRIRGLKQLETIDIGSEASTFASYVNKNVSNLNTDLIIGIGRSLRVKLSCLYKDYNKLIVPTNEVFLPETSAQKINGSTNSSASDDEALIRELNSEIEVFSNKKETSFKGAGKEFNLVMEAPKFKESVSVINFDEKAGMLWIGGKSGILSGFYLKNYLENSSNSNRIDSICNENSK
jgi:WD40 repeat protein